MSVCPQSCLSLTGVKLKCDVTFYITSEQRFNPPRRLCRHVFRLLPLYSFSAGAHEQAVTQNQWREAQRRIIGASFSDQRLLWHIFHIFTSQSSLNQTAMCFFFLLCWVFELLCAEFDTRGCISHFCSLKIFKKDKLIINKQSSVFIYSSSRLMESRGRICGPQNVSRPSHCCRNLWQALTSQNDLKRHDACSSSCIHFRRVLGFYQPQNRF